jgi:diphthamide biosynthesis methyltransferase
VDHKKQFFKEIAEDLLQNMLYVIGLGLGDVKDITVKGLEIVKRCELIYLEAYTSILTCGKDEMVRLSQS